MEPDKEIRADAKLKNLPAEELEILWEFRNPEKGGKKLKFSSIRVQIPLRYGFTVSASTLSDFYVWLRLKRQWDRAQATALQARLELAKDTTISDEELDRFQDRVLKMEAAETGNAKNYVAIRRLGLVERTVAQKDQAIAQNDKRLQQTDKSLEHDARKLAILEKKAAFYDAVKAKANEPGTGGVTAEQMEDIERRLKMM